MRTLFLEMAIPPCGHGESQHIEQLKKLYATDSHLQVNVSYVNVVALSMRIMTTIVSLLKLDGCAVNVTLHGTEQIVQKELPNALCFRVFRDRSCNRRLASAWVDSSFVCGNR